MRMTISSHRFIALSVLFGLCGCAELDALNAAQTLDMASPPPPPQPIFSYADQPDTPPQIDAKGVIDKGETSGEYNGARYVCGDTQCKSAIRSAYPLPPQDHKTKD